MFMFNFNQRLCSVALIMLTAILMIRTVMAQVVVPPRIHWIGPEASCDYPSIQDALDDIFDCGIFACPPGINQLPLSANYAHSVQIIVNKTFNVRGGYQRCEGTFNGVDTVLSAVSSGQRRFVIAPPDDAAITNIFSDLNMFSTTAVAQGGVIVMAEGNATLRLEGSRVNFGFVEQGGGIALRGGGNALEIVDSLIVDNTAVRGIFADGEGGGIYCENGGTINFISGNIGNNEADTNGGGVMLDNCQLMGSTEQEDRFIRGNTVRRSSAADAFGKGGGIYARGAQSLIQMGALLSRTQIENNRVFEWQPDTDQTNIAAGGGLHLHSQARAEFKNVQFVQNQAPNGGAISMELGSTIEMDRTSGACLAPRKDECSAFIDNEATGDNRAGIGSALHVNASDTSVTIRRRVLT